MGRAPQPDVLDHMFQMVGHINQMIVLDKCSPATLVPHSYPTQMCHQMPRVLFLKKNEPPKICPWGTSLDLRAPGHFGSLGQEGTI